MTDITVNLTIAGRNYPLKVNANDVANLKEAEKMINDKINLYEKSFSVKDKQDLLAMCIINFASENSRKQTELMEYENIALQLKDTEQYLNNYLNKTVL
jgi:cell division protein ZapA (FtsZ GTPase activity inhibitor)